MAANDAQYDLIASPASIGSGAFQTNSRRAAEVGELVTQLKRDFRARDALYQEVDKAIFLENEVSIPEAYRATTVEVRSPIPTHIVNTVTAMMSLNPAQVHFEPVAFGDVHMQNATLREHFFEASWRRQEEESRRRLFRSFMHSLVAKGEGVLKTMERKKRAWNQYDRYSAELETELTLDDDEGTGDYAGLTRRDRSQLYDARTEEYKRHAPYPLVSTDVLPETFYYVKGEDGFTNCTEVKQVPYYDALLRYKAGLDAKGRVVAQAAGLPQAEWHRAMEGGTTLTMIECWGYQRVCYVLCGPNQSGGSTPYRGTPVKELKHGYGDRHTRTLRGPYAHALGVTTAARVPDKAGLSVLFGFLHLFRLLDSLLTIQGNAAFLYGFGAFKRATGQGQLALPPFGRDAQQAQGSGGRERVEPGTIFPYDIAPIDMPSGGPDLDKLIVGIRQFLELALPSVVQGSINGDESGYALNQAAHLAKLAWQPIVDNAQFALAERVGWESWLIENRIGEKVYAWGEVVKERDGTSHKSSAGWLGVGPEDLNGVHRYTCRLDPETPANKMTDVRLHKEMLALKLEYPDQAVEAMGNSPDEVERGWLVWELKQDPAVRNKLRERVLQKLGTIDQRTLRNTPEQGGQNGMPAGAGGDYGAASRMGQVFSPGNGMPLTPGIPPGGQVPQGMQSAMGSMTPPTGLPGAQSGAGPIPGLPSGANGVRPPPPGHRPLPGQ